MSAVAVAQVVSSLGSVAIAALAILVNSRTTRENLRAQRASLERTLEANARQIRDERLWDRRMALHEDLGSWSGDAYLALSRFAAAVQQIPAESFVEDFASLYEAFQAEVGEPWATLAGRAELYASADVVDAFWAAQPYLHLAQEDVAGGPSLPLERITDRLAAVAVLQQRLRETVERFGTDGPVEAPAPRGDGPPPPETAATRPA